MINSLYQEARTKMDRAQDHVIQELASLRSGRANPALLDHVKVEYYGTLQPLKHLSNITAPEARLLVVEPYDKTQLGVVEKAILQSDLGLNPRNDGNVILLPIPALTEERRKELVKHAHGIIEEGKVTVRNVRRDVNGRLKALESGHEISGDNLHRAMDNIQELTNEHMSRLDTVFQAREQEILND